MRTLAFCWAELNEDLLRQCQKRRERTLRGHDQTIGQRFGKDREMLLPLATFVVVVVFALTENYPERQVDVMTAEKVILTPPSLAEESAKPGANSKLDVLLSFLLSAAVILIVLYLQDVKMSDLYQYAALNLLLGRVIWISLWIWIFLRSPRGMQYLKNVVRVSECCTRLWTADGSGGFAMPLGALFRGALAHARA